jgi:hypothetical protein
MTTAHRPTWAPARGGEEQGGMRMFVASRARSAKDQPGQLSMKVRGAGQATAADLDGKDLKAELEAKEREHMRKVKGVNFEGGWWARRGVACIACSLAYPAARKPALHYPCCVDPSHWLLTRAPSPLVPKTRRGAQEGPGAAGGGRRPRRRRRRRAQRRRAGSNTAGAGRG